MPALYPSLLAADQADWHTQIERLTPYCHGFHLDIIDQSYAPNSLIEPHLVQAIAHQARKPVWVHLMVQNPKTVIENLTLEPGSIMSFHAEYGDGILKLINFISEKKYKPSIAIHPKTAVTEVFPFLEHIHQVLIMSVNPGLSGQPFIPDVMSKLDPLISYRTMNKLNFRIGMDGGITPENIKSIVDHGVDDIAIGSALFNNPDPVTLLKKLTTYLHAEI